MNERLWINNEYIPLSKSINASLTKSITDIQKPDTRKATYSKSTRVPNSSEAAQVFGHIFEINLTNLSFNPQVKSDIRYEVNGEPILDGYCQLKKITQLDNKDIEYEIVMFGTVANIFQDMGEKYLDDADMVTQLDQWNHPFTKEIQQKSWATEVYNSDSAGFVPFALGTGYVYPLIDYGLVTNLVDFPFYFMPCSLYVREYLDAIFDSNGYSYTSSFFDSTYFKSLIIPQDPRNNQLTNAEIQALQFSANTPEFTSTGTDTSGLISANGNFTAVDTIIFTNEIDDPAGVYNPATGEYSVGPAQAGLYDINALIDINATFNPIGGASVVCTSDIQGGLYVYINGVQQVGVPFFITYGDFDTATYSTGSRTTDTAPTYPSPRVDYLDGINSTRFSQTNDPNAAINIERGGPLGVPDQYLVTLNNIQLNNGDVVTIRWKARYKGLGNDPTKCFRDIGGTYYPGTAQVIMSVGAFYNKCYNQYPGEGSTYKIEKAIPKNIKQKDFFMSLVKMFNLWVDVDPDDPKNYLIEPRDDFLGNEVVNIQQKLSQDRAIDLIPMAKLDTAEYYFTYKQDKDHLNQKYEGDHNRIYGDRYLNNTSDFVTSKKKTDVIFSPTPLSAPPNNTRVLSTIIQLDDQGQAKSVDSNIRILYYGGLKPGELWNHLNYSGIPTPYVTYPYAGHADDPFTWTEDINWGLVVELYYDDNVNPIVYTDNNLVNKYYSNMLQAYTAEESKICTAYFNVTPTDFREWDFTKLYWFENAYWRLQKIEGYNPTGEDLTKCTFLYLTDVPSFSSSSGTGWGGDDGVTPDGTGGGAVTFGETSPAKGANTGFNENQNNYAKYGVEVLGDKNYIHPSSEYVKIQGDSNIVNGGSRNINIQGSNNTLEPGVINVTLINTSGVTVEESNVTYIDGKIVSGRGAWVTETATFTADNTATGYYLDFSAVGDARLPVGADGQEWIFKNVGTADVTIVSINLPPDTIDGEDDLVLAPFESIRLRWNEIEGEFNIIN